MRRYLIAVAATLSICASFVFAPSAKAGYSGPYLCWTGINGGTNCVGLPVGYRLRGVAVPSAPYGTVTFTLTRYLIDRVLPQYVSTEGMYPGQRAILYAPGDGIYSARYY